MARPNCSVSSRSVPHSSKAAVCACWVASAHASRPRMSFSMNIWTADRLAPSSAASVRKPARVKASATRGQLSRRRACGPRGERTAGTAALVATMALLWAMLAGAARAALGRARGGLLGSARQRARAGLKRLQPGLLGLAAHAVPLLKHLQRGAGAFGDRLPPRQGGPQLGVLELECGPPERLAVDGPGAEQASVQLGGLVHQSARGLLGLFGGSARGLGYGTGGFVDGGLGGALGFALLVCHARECPPTRISAGKRARETAVRTVQRRSGSQPLRDWDVHVHSPRTL